MRRAHVRKYVQVVRTGFRRAAAERATLIGRALFVVIILVVFSQLWSALRKEGLLPAADAVDMLWYLALTEWIALGTPMAWSPINQDVQSGDVAYQLARPISYPGFRLAEATGQLLLSWLVVGVVALLSAWALAGALPSDPRGLLAAAPLALAAGFVTTIFYVWIGLLAFWMQDARPAYFIFQKLLFVLGGLILPLSIYPDWLRSLADWTPFTSLLYGVGRGAFGWDAAAAGETLWRLGLSAVVALLLVRLTSARARRALLVNGG